MQTFLNSHKFITFFIILILIFSTILILKILFLETYIDFTNYYLATQVFIHGSNPYIPNSYNFPFPYPPPTLLLFVPFSIFSLVPSAKFFVIVSLLLLLISLYLLVKLSRNSMPLLLMAFLTILVFNFFPTKFSLAQGQINVVVLFLVVVFIVCYIKKRVYLAGMVIALAISFKLYPFLLIPYLIIDKQWKILISAITTLFFIAIVVCITVPFSYITYYFSNTLPSQLNTGGGMYYFDQSFSAAIARIIQNPMSKYIAQVLATIAMIVTFYIIWIYKKRNDIKLLIIGILLISNLIFNNFNWQHHFIWLLVPLFLTFFYIREKKLAYRYYLVLGASYLLMGFNIKNPLSVIPFMQSHVLYGALVLYLLNLHLLISNNKRRINKK